MLSTADIVAKIDKNLCSLISGLKTYGIAKTARKDDKLLPYNGIDYVGVDDMYKAQAYHRKIGVTSTKERDTGYGDVRYWFRNEDDMILILRYDESVCGDLFTFVQASISGVIKDDEIKFIEIIVDSANLVDEQVWRQEYGNTTPFALFGAQRLIQINYTITTLFDKNCIKIPNCQN